MNTVNSAIVEVYVKLIREGKWALDDVPEKWREDVRAAMGGDADVG